MAETGKLATFELLCVGGSGFLLDLSAVAGNRSQGSTWDCAHSSPLPPLTLPLHLYPCLLLRLSSSCYLYPPVITLPPSASSVLLVAFCHLLSFSASAPSLFPPYLILLTSLLLSGLTALEWFTSHHVLTVTTVRPVSHCRA